MNKTAWLVLALLMFAPLVMPAQATVFEFGGGTGFENRGGDIWSGSENGGGFYQYDFRPHFAVFLNHNTTLGAYFNVNIEDYSGYNLFELELGPRVGYYFRKSGPGYPFVQSRVSFGQLFYNTTKKGNYSESHIAIEIGGGYLYLLNQNVGVTGSVYYEQHYYDEIDTGWASGNKFGFQLGLRVFIY